MGSLAGLWGVQHFRNVGMLRKFKCFNNSESARVRYRREGICSITSAYIASTVMLACRFGAVRSDKVWPLRGNR